MVRTHNAIFVAVLGEGNISEANTEFFFPLKVQHKISSILSTIRSEHFSLIM